MKTLTVTTQQELDAALKEWTADTHYPIEIKGRGYFEISGSATVWASGSATVQAYGSATVRASDSATVQAYGSATVHASGSATVRAFGSATVRAYGSATVRAGQYNAVVLSGLATSQGGVIVCVPKLTTPQEWCEFYGVQVIDGVAMLYKGLDVNFKSPYGTSYQPGETPIAHDWDGGKEECGGGLHFSPRPFMTLEFNPSATKFCACPVALTDIVVHPHGSSPQKVKARGCCVPVMECDVDGNLI